MPKRSVSTSKIREGGSANDLNISTRSINKAFYVKEEVKLFDKGVEQNLDILVEINKITSDFSNISKMSYTNRIQYF